MKLFGLLFNIFIGGLLMVSYRYANQAFTQKDLSEFFETGTRCNSLMRLAPYEDFAQKALRNENTCYLMFFETTFAGLPEDDRDAYLTQSLATLKKAERLDQQTLMLLAHDIVVVRNAQKQAQYLDGQKELMDMALSDNLLTIAETNSQFKVPIVAVLAWSKNTIVDLKERSLNPPYANQVNELANRYQALKDKWLVQDEEIANFKNQWLASNDANL